MCLFHFSTCFEQPSAHHQENRLYQYIIWYISLCVGDCLVFRLGVPLTCIPDNHLHRIIEGVSRLEDITAGGDFLGLCDQKSSYKHVSDFGRLRSYDRLKLRREGKDY
jgi:hypothetical protein